MQTTTNIGLKTYEANDSTDWLGEFNYNMNKIDQAVGSQNDQIEVIEETTRTAVTTANTANTTANNANTTATQALDVANSKPSINDTVAGATSTYSSNKIEELISGAGGAVIDDTETSASKTWSSSKINTEIEAVETIANAKASINDTTASNTSTYSSNKINSLMGVSAIDFSSKTVVETGTVSNQRLTINYTVASDGYYQIHYLLHKAYVVMSIGGSSLLNGVIIGSANDYAGDGTDVASPIYYLKAGQTIHAIGYLEVSGDTNNQGEILKFNPL